MILGKTIKSLLQTVSFDTFGSKNGQLFMLKSVPKFLKKSNFGPFYVKIDKISILKEIQTLIVELVIDQNNRFLSNGCGR